MTDIIRADLPDTGQNQIQEERRRLELVLKTSTSYLRGSLATMYAKISPSFTDDLELGLCGSMYAQAMSDNCTSLARNYGLEHKTPERILAALAHEVYELAATPARQLHATDVLSRFFIWVHICLRSGTLKLTDLQSFNKTVFIRELATGMTAGVEIIGLNESWGAEEFQSVLRECFTAWPGVKDRQKVW